MFEKIKENLKHNLFLKITGFIIALSFAFNLIPAITHGYWLIDLGIVFSGRIIILCYLFNICISLVRIKKLDKIDITFFILSIFAFCIFILTRF